MGRFGREAVTEFFYPESQGVRKRTCLPANFRFDASLAYNTLLQRPVDVVLLVNGK